MKLFEENKYKISLSPEMRQINEFKAVWSRDRGGKIAGDSDGREKLYAIAELSYVYFQCYYKSPYNRYGDEDKHVDGYSQPDIEGKGSETAGTGLSSDEGVVQFDKHETRRILRKIDYRLIPLLGVLYL